MDKEGLRYVQTFVSDWLSAPIQIPDIYSIDYCKGSDGGIMFLADFRFGDTKIGFVNRVQNPYELSYFDNTMKVLKKEIAIYWDKDVKPTYINDEQLYVFEIDLDEDLEDYILLPINVKDYKFANNVNDVIFDNMENRIIIALTDLDNLEGCKISLACYKAPKGDE